MYETVFLNLMTLSLCPPCFFHLLCVNKRNSSGVPLSRVKNETEEHRLSCSAKLKFDILSNPLKFLFNLYKIIVIILLIYNNLDDYSLF